MPPLFSGNGRHRRPRQAPSFMVVAGVTGAGIAIPLLGAGAASAADGDTWDKVAECESGGLWSAEEDNGLYGGLQLDEETWEEYGGKEIADRPDLASRGQQIEIAEKILKAEGPDAWSDCAEGSGLSEDPPESSDAGSDSSGSASETPVPESPYPGSPSESTPDEGAGDSSDSGGTEDGDDAAGLPDHATPPSPDESADPSDTADPSDAADPSESADPPDSGDSSGSWDPAPGTGAGDDDRGGDSDEHPSREDDDRGDAASSDGEHRVDAGETLSGIAEKYDVRGGWTELYERNRDVIGSDPCLILPGQELKL